MSNSWSVFNNEQLEAMEELNRLAPSEKCYCGWHRHGTCPNCPPEYTTQHKLDVMCAVCRNYPRPGEPPETIIHNIRCSKRKPL